MTSAVASNLLAPTAASSSSTPCGWLAPRVSFSGRDAIAAEEHEETAVASTSPVATPAISKDFIDFEFSSFGGCAASMLPADELFADGKLLPLRKAAAPEPEPCTAAPPPARSQAMPPPPAEQTMKPLRAAAGLATADQYVFSPKAPSCSSRWRELLGLKRASSSSASQSPRPSPSPSALAKTPGRSTTTGSSTSSAARSLKFLLQRSNNNNNSNNGRASSDLASAPLLRDSSDSEASLSLASSRFSLSSSSSSSGGHDSHDDIVINPRFSLDSGADLNHHQPPRLRLVRSSGRRHSTSGPCGPPPPPQPRCVSVDSPRMNSSGKIVFQQSPLERSCSSPCSFHHAAAAASKSRSCRAAGVDRSYSSGGVRVAPVVLNVPVCSRPVFGFFKDKQKDSSAADNARASRTSSTLGRKAPPPPQQRWSGELPKLCSG